MRATALLAAGAALALVAAFGAGTVACTYVSGVEDYEIRRVVPAPTASGASPADPGNGGDASASGGSGDAGTTITAPPSGPESGPKVCGAEGTWMACEAPGVLSTCADRCAAKGLACVDSCCLEDQLGKYPAKIGAAYSLPDLLCSGSAVVANTTGGYCTDPLLAAAATGMVVRCCCK